MIRMLIRSMCSAPQTKKPPVSVFGPRVRSDKIPLPYLSNPVALNYAVIGVTVPINTIFHAHWHVLRTDFNAQFENCCNFEAVVLGIEGRYVTALYSAASQMNQLDEVEKHMRDLQKELLKPKMVDFIETSMVSRAVKAKLLQEVGKQAGMPDAACNFLSLVAENGRLKLLRRMINMFLTVMVAHRNEALCEVITAKPLDDGARNSLMEALQRFVKEGKKITLTEKVDPSIIGGMIVGIEDKHIDMSIARKVQMYTDLLTHAV